MAVAKNHERGLWLSTTWIPGNGPIQVSLPHPATSGSRALDTAIFSLSCPTALWAVVLAAEGRSVSASPRMRICVPSWLPRGSFLRARGWCPTLLSEHSLGLTQRSVHSRLCRESGLDLALESTMWATALDLPELESSINRNQHLFIQIHVKITKKNKE